MSDFSKLEKASDFPIYVIFSGDCHHKQMVTNNSQVNIQSGTYYYCKKCRTFRIVASRVVD
jgi:hypothetical protein